jgi:hypothetical protein
MRWALYVRNNNVFERDVTQTEQDIIDQRVALQRKMFEEYEKREKQRKVRRETCPHRLALLFSPDKNFLIYFPSVV